MRWLADFADRFHPLALPGAWVLVALWYHGWVFLASSGTSCCWESDLQLWGTILIYSIMPGYLIAAATYLRRSQLAAYSELGQASGQDLSSWAERKPSGWLITAALTAGLAFGIAQYEGISWDDPGQGNAWQDFSMVGSNVIVWMTIFWVAVHQLHAGVLLKRLGTGMQVDLYRMSALKPFARVAVRGLLVIMGALALMPLQSLDAQFRMDNYVFGMLFGLPVAAALFVLPLIGVHHSILAAKRSREGELQAAIDQANRSTVAALEALVAHRDRIRALHSWPLDFSVIFRVAFYLIIPPLAWVGAALVENLVQGFLD